MPEAVLYGWDIEDPIGADYQTFRETARKIERRLGQFLATVGLES